MGKAKPRGSKSKKKSGSGKRHSLPGWSGDAEMAEMDVRPNTTKRREPTGRRRTKASRGAKRSASRVTKSARAGARAGATRSLADAKPKPKPKPRRGGGATSGRKQRGARSKPKRSMKRKRR